tara:strand:+ start:80 stop:343 length:264 start_codon:yes stop_codon:yes gene_type:complete
MTPKEKAKELVERFLSLDMYDYEDYVYWLEKENAKQCALICVDEILKANEKISLKGLSETMQTNDILCQLTDNAMYWQEVKQEIIKL